MEFERIFKVYTITVVIVLILITLVCTSVVVISKFNSNLGLKKTAEIHYSLLMDITSSEICTQK